MTDGHSLVDLAFRASLDDSVWAEWTLAVKDSFGAVAANLFVLGEGDNPIERMHHIWPSARALDDYYGGLWQDDPLIGVVNGCRGDGPHLRSAPRSEVEDASAYAAWYRGVSALITT